MLKSLPVGAKVAPMLNGVENVHGATGGQSPAGGQWHPAIIVNILCPSWEKFVIVARSDAVDNPGQT